jgi:hypothetical protein
MKLIVVLFNFHLLQTNLFCAFVQNGEVLLFSQNVEIVGNGLCEHGIIKLKFLF